MNSLVVLFSVLALAAAKPNVVVPLTYQSVVPATSSVSQYSSSVVHGSPVYNVPAVYASSVYPAVAPVALAQAPHSPAVVLDAVNGVPLDTPEVVAARAAHYQAKALSGHGVHYLKKRSVVAPVSHVSTYSAPVVTAYSTPVVSGYASPVVSAYSAPVYSSYPSTVYSGYASPSVYSPVAYSSVVPKTWSVHPY